MSLCQKTHPFKGFWKIELSHWYLLRINEFSDCLTALFSTVTQARTIKEKSSPVSGRLFALFFPVSSVDKN